MNDLKEWYFLDLKLDVGEIMLYANQLYSGKIGINKFLSDTRPFKLKGIDEKRYEEILKLMLEILCPHLKDVFCHSRLKMIFFYKRYQVTFFRVYMEIISDIFNSESEYKEELKISCKKSWEIYLEAVYFSIKSQESLLDGDWQEIKNNIIEDLAEVDKVKLDSYNMYMYQLISNTTMPQQLNDISLEWQDIYGMLNDGKKKKNILNKIQGIYKR